MIFSIPKEYNKILSLLYGDFNKYMSIEKRTDEFYNAISRIETFGKQ